ncbi:MAG: DUF2252 domain-containing protein [Candidatus Promineifilaceae bacterium]|jgi:uncharacterized protein (DUF2252 family)
MAQNQPLHEQLQRPRNIRRAIGKMQRKYVPRGSHGAWQPAADRPDPLDLLQAQDEGRLQRLLPIKYGRMAEAPFAFLRGSAVVMANDLASTPDSGQYVALCGDAHLANFGFFASPERKLVFDINDFDECYFGPWEWDIKRLAASVVVAGRENGFDAATNRDLAALAANVYRRAMRRLAKMPALDLWYLHVAAGDIEELFDEKASSKSKKEIRKIVRKAMSRTQKQTLEKLTELVDSRRRIRYEPPLLVPFREIDLSSELERMGGDMELDAQTVAAISGAWRQYLESLPDDRRLIMDNFHVTDAALRVGGVGSVGTRCFIFLLQSGAGDEGLILQLKETGPSVLEAYLPKRDLEHQAERVVIGQRLIQAVSDPFLGWNRAPISGNEYYWRQLKDMKGSIDVAELDESGFGAYVTICAASLARAHARTGDPSAISGYLGKGKVFDQAVAQFAETYADQTEKDHAALLRAIEDGRVAVDSEQ